MRYSTMVRAATGAAFLSFALLTGCKSAEQSALEQAKSQAASTNAPQQVQYIDANGDTVTTVVAAPIPGQTQQVQTSITPAPPGPKPHRTKPVVTAYGAMPGSGTTPPVSPDPSSLQASAPMQAAGPQLASGPAAPGGVAPLNPAPAVNVEVAAGTELSVRINQRIDVKHVAAGEHFSGEIVQPVTREGITVIPRGTPVRGRIDAAHRRGHFKGRSILELRLTSMVLNGREYQISTRDLVRTKKGKGKRTAGFIGGLTGAGMLIGGIASGGVGLAIGAASGAGAGTLLAGTTGNRDIVIPAESVVRFRLADGLVLTQ